MQHDDQDFQRKWAGQEQMLVENLRLNRQILAQLTLQRVRFALNRGALLTALGALPAIVVVPWLGNFVYEHWSEARMAVPAALLHVYVLFLVSLRVRYILMTMQVDYGKPVVEIQRQIAGLRRSSLRMLKWVLLTATLVWPAMVAVALKGFAGVDAYRLFGWNWILWNLLAGLAVIPVLLWIAKRLGEGTIGGAGGYNLNRAEVLLEELTNLEKGN